MLTRLFYCALCCFRQATEGRRILDRNIRQDLSIHFDSGLLQSGNELVVVQSIQARRGADADDPQAAEVTLSHLAIAIGIYKRLLDGFFSELIQLALVEVVTLRKAEKFLAAVMPLCSAFDSRHCKAPLCVGQHAADLRRVRGGCDDGLAELSFPSRSFLRQDMARERMVALDLPRRRDLEALGRAFMRF